MQRLDRVDPVRRLAELRSERDENQAEGLLEAIRLPLLSNERVLKQSLVQERRCSLYRSRGRDKSRSGGTLREAWHDIRSACAAKRYDPHSRSASAAETFCAQCLHDATRNLLTCFCGGCGALNERGRGNAAFSEPTDEIDFANASAEGGKDLGRLRRRNGDTATGALTHGHEDQQNAMPGSGRASQLDVQEMAKRSLVVGSTRGATVIGGVAGNRPEAEIPFRNSLGH